MNIFEKAFLNAKLKMKYGLQKFVVNENGDTNFVSMLIIIGIVVVLAAGFLALVNTQVLPKISQKVNDFIDGL